MVQPFLFESVSGEIFAAVTLPAWLACGALWRRAQVLQDRKDQQESADRAVLVDLVTRVITALDANTDALKEATRA